MECHDVRLLLTFAQRGCEKLDVTEREALAQHLDKCPDCGCLAQADRRLDESLGKVMRDVPVPAELKKNVLKRLATHRRPIGWKRVAAAAAVLLAISGATAWYAWPLPVIDVPFAQTYLFQGRGYKSEDVEKYYHEHGLRVRPPQYFDYDYLQNMEIVEIKGRRVAKLTFSRSNGADTAEVYVLSPQKFNLDDLPETTIPYSITMTVREEEGFKYLIYSRGDYKSLKRELS